MSGLSHTHNQQKSSRPSSSNIIHNPHTHKHTHTIMVQKINVYLIRYSRQLGVFTMHANRCHPFLQTHTNIHPGGHATTDFDGGRATWPATSLTLAQPHQVVVIRSKHCDKMRKSAQRLRKDLWCNCAVRFSVAEWPKLVGTFRIAMIPESTSSKHTH